MFTKVVMYILDLKPSYLNLLQIGGLIGGSVAALLISRLNPWMLFAVAIGVSGVMQVIIPLCTNLVALGVVMTVGTAFAILYDSGNKLYFKCFYF